MKDAAYLFAEKVDQLIKELPLEAFHQRIGRAKKLREELYPLSRLATFLKLPGLEVEVEAFEDSGRADGHIRITGFYERDFEVQLTYAGYGGDDALRSELLVKQGWTPGSGTIFRERRKGPIFAEGTAVDHNDYIGRISSSVVEQFRKKTLKTYAAGTVLLIAFEENGLYYRSAWSALLIEIESNGGIAGSQFSEVYLFNGATNEIHRIA